MSISRNDMPKVLRIGLPSTSPVIDNGIPRSTTIHAARLKFRTDMMQLIVPAMQSVSAWRTDDIDALPGVWYGRPKWIPSTMGEIIAKPIEIRNCFGEDCRRKV